MKHINVDTLPEPVRQFIRGVAAGREGSVIEDGGKPLARVFPVPPPSDSTDPEWVPAKNHRRAELIDRKIDGIITSEERAELANLQEQLRRFVDRVAPLPLEPMRKLHQELLEKAARTAADSSK